MLTADTITDEQIRGLMGDVKPLSVADILCRIALGIPLPDKTTFGDAYNWELDPTDPNVRAQARYWCARFLNARAKK